PAGFAARAAAAAATEATTTAATTTAARAASVGREIDPATIAPGARLVQLGAFDDRATAVTEWQRLSRLHGDLLGDRGFVVQQAESGGRTFYRLRMAGLSDLAESRQLCAALNARNTQCIPVTAR
ncbi:MAG: SPOR domain-containing protein, partial [Rhodobacteraceae bacterium]|nr:SPOR domain-containing protein [Paracoccaceae bacterium]